MNDGGPAFSLIDQKDPWGKRIVGREGISIRDYFAAKAMQAAYNDYNGDNWIDRLAKRAYEMADAMLKAREGK